MQVLRSGMIAAVVAAALAVVALQAGTAFAGDQTWHKNLEDGVAAAEKSGKPLLVVTAWKSGI
jgi:hypothetical protein